AFAADVGAAAGRDPDVAGDAAAENVFAQQPQPVGLLDGVAEALNGQQMLAADVVVAALSPDAVAADHDAFENAVRIALDQAPVLVDVRLAFVRVAGHELRLRLCAAAALPLDAGRGPGSATAAHAGGLDLIDHFFRGHVEDRLDPGRIPADGDVIVDRVRVDVGPVLGQQARLVGEERMLLDGREIVGLVERADQVRAQRLAGRQRRHQIRHDVGGDVGVERARVVGSADDDGGIGPRPATAPDDPQRGVKVAALNAEAQVLVGVEGAFGFAVLADTHGD